MNQSLRDWEGALERLASALEGARDMNPGLARCWERCRDGMARLKALDEDESRGLRWVEVSRHSFAAHWTPLDVGAELGERIQAQDGTWVFTSATLAVGDDFSHFLSRVGVPDADSAVLPSPFNYRENARLYLPRGLPQPAAPDYVERVLDCVWPLVEACGGGAFLLFTSYRALNAARGWIDGRALPGPLLVQGEGPRTELLTRFRSTTNAVLLGTSSFWQGVDVRGPALRLVVIDKLPFASPGDPLIQARLHAIRLDGGDPFTEFQLPQAVLALKQGVGRLIRDFSDRGLVVICDPRLRTRGYGRLILQSMPDMPVLEEQVQALDFIASLSADANPGARLEHREAAGV
ncbi:MAG: ATP-dependent DNA helicase [Proteobacteria bacterium]|nr:ATP-dependent DNA helicase [Pseudomonadota bacterium]